MIQPVPATPAQPNSSRRWIVAGATLLLVVLAALLGAAALGATAPVKTPPADLDGEMLRVAKGLYCPVCPSTPLDVCETQACVQWRALIKEKLAAGESEQQIRAYFVAQYGERVLGAPPAEGFNLGAYVFPFILLIVGAVFLYVTMRRWQALRTAQATAAAPVRGAQDAPPAEPPSSISPEMAERIRLALKERE